MPGYAQYADGLLSRPTFFPHQGVMMERRKFLGSTAVAGMASALAASAHAQATAAPVKWRMSTSWPKSLDTIYGSADQLCKRVGELTDGAFEIRAFAGGELVPPGQN